MNQPGKIKAEFGTIVLSDEVKRLHAVFEVSGKEAPGETIFVFFPGYLNFISMFFATVNWEVLFDNLRPDEIFSVKLHI